MASLRGTAALSVGALDNHIFMMVMMVRITNNHWSDSGLEKGMKKRQILLGQKVNPVKLQNKSQIHKTRLSFWIQVGEGQLAQTEEEFFLSDNSMQANLRLYLPFVLYCLSNTLMSVDNQSFLYLRYSKRRKNKFSNISCKKYQMFNMGDFKSNLKNIARIANTVPVTLYSKVTK